MKVIDLNSFVRPEHRVWDEGTMNEVIQYDCYKLAERDFSPDDFIIDIGANIGFFSGLVLEKGAGSLTAVEASPCNFAALKKNLLKYRRPGIRLYNAAAWRSDTPTTTRRLHEFPEDGNTGGVNVLQNVGECEVPTLGLDFLIGDKTVTYLKVDCEGSEYPVLFTCTKLSQVREISIETHPVNHLLEPGDIGVPEQNTPQGLGAYLERLGFTVTSEARPDMPEGFAYVWAKRRE